MALSERVTEESEEEITSQNGYTAEQIRDRMITVLALLHDFEEEVAVRLLKELSAAKLEETEKNLVEELLKKADLFLFDEAQAQIEEYLGKA